MFSNYFRIAWRTLVRNKVFSATNISGLALGITCSLLIMLWVQDERSVDAFHDNGDYLYQVYVRQYYDGRVEPGYATQGLLAEELKKTFPEIAYASGLEYAAAPGAGSTLQAGNKVIKKSGFYAGADFFTMFSYPLLQGKPELALNSPSAIAISKKTAEYFFGSPENAIGKVIRFDDKEDVLVTAVFGTLPANSSLQFDFLRNWKAFLNANAWAQRWGSYSPSTFIQLRKDADPVAVQAKIQDFVSRYVPEREGFREELALQRYREKYLQSIFHNGRPEGGRIGYVRLFTAVAIFLWLIACINFMNLATAQSVRRAREVGLRKVIGATRSSLIRQFIGEAMLLTGISLIVALLLTALLMPVFNELTGKDMRIPVTQPVFWAALCGTVVITGFVAGSYPALFLSALQPVRILKSRLRFSSAGIFFRKGLVVFQFTLSAVLIVGVIVVDRQMNYIRNKNIGFNRNNLLYIPIEGKLAEKYTLFKEEALKIPGIINISKMRNSPTGIEHHTTSIRWPGKDPNLVVSFADGVVGYDFVKTLDLKMALGRDFSKEFATDSAAYILNETAVEKIGFKDPLGKTVSWGNRDGAIVGVVKDFHFNSMHKAVEPLIIRLDENWTWGNVMVRIRGDNMQNTIRQLETLYKELNPKYSFTYQFSDLEYARLYKSEQLVSQLAGYFAFLAIFISCLGLFGLATFTAAQRTKEIGVRKVMGASVSRITVMLSVDFLKLVAIALLVAVPVSSLFMNQWLNNFAYSIEMDWRIFALAGVVTICIAWLTVSYQSIRAARMNPVKTLRTE